MEKITIRNNRQLLSAIGMGTQGDHDLPDGIHLRWAYAPYLGWPRNGFSIHRRPHDPKAIRLGSCKEEVQTVALPIPSGAPLLSTYQAAHLLFWKRDGMRMMSVAQGNQQVFSGIEIGADALKVTLGETLIPYFLDLEVALNVREGDVVVKGYHEETLKFEFSFMETYFGTGGPAPDWPDWEVFDHPIFLMDNGVTRLEFTGSRGMLKGVGYFLDPCLWNTDLGTVNLPVTSNYASTDLNPMVLARIGPHPEPNLPPLYAGAALQLVTHYVQLARELRTDWEALKIVPTGLEGWGPNVVDTGGNASSDVPSFEFPQSAALLMLAADYNIARMMGLGIQDLSDAGNAVGHLYDYRITGQWRLLFEGRDIELDVEYVLYGLKMAPQSPLGAPKGLVADTALLPVLGGDGARSMHARLRWQSEGDASATQFLVERKLANQAWQMLTMEPFNGLNLARPVVVDPAAVADLAPWQNFPFIDLLPAWGTYTYRVSSLDLFGRVSGPSNEATVEYLDNAPPPPPEALQTTLIDPQNPDLPPADQMALRDFAVAFPERPSTPVIQMSWEWPAEYDTAFPGMEDFNVFFHKGLMDAGAAPWGSSIASIRFADGKPSTTAQGIGVIAANGFPSVETRPGIQSELGASGPRTIHVYCILIGGVTVDAPAPSIGKAYYNVSATARRRTQTHQLVASPMAEPALGFRIDREPPAAPSFPLVPKTYSSLPDRAGQVWVKIALPSATRLRIFHASDVELQARADKLPLPLREDLKPEMRLRAIAMHGVSRSAFSALHASPMNPETQPYSFSLPYLPSSLHVFHVVATSATGVDSTWPQLTAAEWESLQSTGGQDTVYATAQEKLLKAFMVTEVLDALPPPMPRAVGLFPGDGEITLSWWHDPALSTRIDGYWVFRSKSAPLAENILQMRALTDGILSDATELQGEFVRGELDGKALWSYRDRHVESGQAYYYQLIAVRSVGNGIELQSHPLPEALTAIARMTYLLKPLQWYKAEFYAGRRKFKLSWHRPEQAVDIKILARMPGKEYWQMAIPEFPEWLPSDSEWIKNMATPRRRGALPIQYIWFRMDGISRRDLPEFMLQTRDSQGSYSATEPIVPERLNLWQRLLNWLRDLFR